MSTVRRHDPELRFAISESQLIALILASVCFLIYSYEIFNFSLSIDEEIRIFGASTRDWVWQGRFFMGFIEAILPPLGNIPFIATLLFAAGLTYFTATVASFYRVPLFQKIVFGVFVVANPAWLYIAEFNTLSYGIGIGLAIAALGFIALVQNRSTYQSVAIGTLCFCALLGIYQAVFLALANGICVVLFSLALNGDAAAGWRLVRRTLAAVILGTILYLVVQKTTLVVMNLQLAYIGGFYRLPELFSHDPNRFHHLVARIRHIFGGGPGYFNTGFIYYTLPLVGLMTAIYQLIVAPTEASAKRLAWLSLAGLLVSLFAFDVISAGVLPDRALVANAFVAGFFASQAVRFRWVKAYAKIALPILVFISVWLSTVLFNADRVARVRDQVFATEIMRDLYRVGLDSKTPTQFLVVGAKSFPREGAFSGPEVFGMSFFEHDGGVAGRIAAFINIIAGAKLYAVELDLLKPHLAEVRKMPMWPAEASVTKIGDILVVKLSDFSPQQLNKLGLQ